MHFCCSAEYFWLSFVSVAWLWQKSKKSGATHFGVSDEHPMLLRGFDRMQPPLLWLDLSVSVLPVCLLYFCLFAAKECAESRDHSVYSSLFKASILWYRKWDLNIFLIFKAGCVNTIELSKCPIHKAMDTACMRISALKKSHNDMSNFMMSQRYSPPAMPLVWPTIQPFCYSCCCPNLINKQFNTTYHCVYKMASNKTEIR